jgi:membrane protease YdiL (CAAX protease family)
MKIKQSAQLTGIILLIVLLFSVCLTGIFLQLFGFSRTGFTALFFSRVLFWGCLLFAYVYARKVEKQNLLLWEDKKYPYWFYLVSVILLFLTIIFGLIIVVAPLKLMGFNSDSDAFKALIPIFKSNRFLLIFFCLTAGFVEEFTFRGYLLPRFEILFKNPHVAIFVSSILFGLLHFGYGNIYQIVCPFFIGLVFAYYYWLYRNIAVIIFCHCIWDMVALYLKTR